ncbi:MAG TPA: response regulator [Candidatus Angelobacter sp.]|jgi:DNA-binding NtrC family response regulator|nr:response regulator [Candidatus Angelobacter sp.]
MSSAAVEKQPGAPLLLIEDEKSVLNFLRTALERYGYGCKTATSALEGISLLEQGDFIGVISDMRTPGGATGADVHAWIMTNRPDLKDKVLFITGDTVNEETMKALKHTGVPYIEKPFRVQQFISTVEKIFGRAK